MNEPTIILSGTDPDLPKQVPAGVKRYTGLREMARGGTAVLQSAFDPVTGRTVAIKKLLHLFRGDCLRELAEKRVAHLAHRLGRRHFRILHAAKIRAEVIPEFGEFLRAFGEEFRWIRRIHSLSIHGLD